MRSDRIKRAQLFYRIGLLCLIWLGFWLTLHHIDRFSFWIDEALTPRRSSQTIWQILRNVIYVAGQPTQDTHPPFYFILIHLSQKLIGVTDFAYRFPSAIFTILSIPLMFQLGRRLFKNADMLGLVAALLMAVSPLNIWYAQEARMYTLLDLLGVILIFIFWETLVHLHNGSPDKYRQITLQWFAVYAVFALCTGLTHIVGAFFVVGHALIWAVLFWRHVPVGRWLVSGTILAGLSIIPFLPRLVPRLFDGAEKSFYQVPFQNILRDLVRGYGLGFTPTENYQFMITLVGGFLLLLLIGFAVLIRNRRWPLLSLLTISMLSPAAIMAAVSFVKPIYTGIRHIMIGHGAFVLFIAIAIWSAWRWAAKIDSAPVSKWRYAAGLLLLSIPLIGATSSIYTHYTSPNVAKDNVRDLVGYIEDRAAAEDIVVYNDPILMLTHEYYSQRAELRVIALPKYPHVFSEETSLTLNDLQQTYARIWYIPSPSDDGRDDDQAVQAFLLENTKQIDEWSFEGRATFLKSVTYQTAAAEAAAIPESPLSFGPLTLTNSGLAAIAPERIWPNTVWDGPLPDSDLEAILTLVGSDGWEWVRHQQPLFVLDEQSAQFGLPWQADRPNVTQLDIPRPLGLAAGEYEVWLSVVNPNGGPLGEKQKLPNLTLPLPAQPAIPLPTNRESIQFDNGISLAQIAVPDLEIRPGHFLPTHVVWQTAADIDTTNLTYKMQIFGPDDQLIADTSGKPGADWVNGWTADGLYRDHAEALFPADAAPGIYRFRWQLLDDGEIVPAKSGQSLFSSDWATLGSVEVLPWPFLDQAPEVQKPVEANFGNFATLTGTNSNQSGDRLSVELVWQVTADPETFYLSYVHLIDPATGQVVSQKDWIPGVGLRPTTGWRTGEYLSDVHELDLTSVVPGTYLLNVGLYEPNSFVRPFVVLNGTDLPNSQIELGEIEIK